jgi:hypothetical protein
MQPTIRGLTANLRIAEAFLHHYYPNLSLQSTSLTPPASSFIIKQPNSQLTPLPIPRCKMYIILFKLITDTTGNGQWRMPWALGKPKWEAVYHYPILSKDGNVAWRILHNRIIMPQQLHKWKK